MQIEQPTEDFAEDSVENVLPSVGETLRQERKRQNLSKNDVADKLHITRHYVAVIESNSFEKFCITFNVPLGKYCTWQFFKTIGLNNCNVMPGDM